MNDAEQRFAERLAEDLGRTLGIGIAVEALEITESDGVKHVGVSILFDGRIETVEAWAPDDASLYRLLMMRAIELWRVSAFSGLVGPV
jgi:hypothetical protein